MIKEFIPYEQALDMKSIGFDEPCLAFYNSKFLESTNFDFDIGTCKDIGECVKTPTYSQCFRWFREKYNLTSWIESYKSNKLFIYEIRPHMFSDYSEGETYTFETHEETELACLIKLIEIVRKKLKDF